MLTMPHYSHEELINLLFLRIGRTLCGAKLSCGLKRTSKAVERGIRKL
jgi:hypothetical protein